MAYEIVFDVTDFERSLGELIRSFENRAPLMRMLAGMMEDAVQENFEQQGRPKWLGWSPRYAKRRGRVRYCSGLVGWLRASFSTATTIWRQSGPMSSMLAFTSRVVRLASPHVASRLITTTTRTAPSTISLPARVKPITQSGIPYRRMRLKCLPARFFFWPNPTSALWKKNRRIISARSTDNPRKPKTRCNASQGVSLS